MAIQKRKNFNTLKKIYERFVSSVKKTGWYVWEENVNEKGACFKLDNGFILELSRYDRSLKQRTSLVYGFEGEEKREKVNSLEQLYRIV